MILGGLLVHGLRPGPQLFREAPDIVYGFMLQMLVTAMLLLVMGGLMATRIFGQVLRLPPDEIRRRLERVYALLPELKDLAPRKAAGLSGGQGKMVALGRALMVGTRAVLLDEPFQGLAPALALRYAEALKRLRAALPDVAILITESNPELLRPLVEQTYVIERGEIAPA